MSHLAKYFWKPFLWLLIICYLSLTPSESLPKMPKFFEYDKIGHLVLYLIFTLLLIKGLSLKLKEKGLSASKLKWIALFVSVFIGGIIEILQANLIRNRHGDITDFLADIIGSVLGTILYNFVAQRFYRFI